MKRIIKYCFILVFLFLISSCKKYGFSYVEGKVIDRATNQPIQGVKLLLEHWKPCTTCPYMWDTVGVTDANGHFKFYFQKKITKQYKMWFVHNNYFIASEELNYKKTNQDILLEPLSFLQIHIKKISPSSNFIKWTVGTCNDKFFHNNAPIDTVVKIPCTFSGGRIISFYWTVFDKDSLFIEQKHIDTLLNRGQTLTLDVPFN